MILARIRYLIAYAASALATVAFGLGFLLSIGQNDGDVTFKRWAGRWARCCMQFAGISVSVEGQNNVPLGGPCVFVANHQSALDVPVVLEAIPVPFGFVAKMGLRSQPIIGAVLRASPSVFVDGTRPRETLDSIHDAAAEISRGSAVLVFPEGERTWSCNLLPFKKRAFLLAAEARVPVVPVTLYNAHIHLDERRRAVRPGCVRVRIDEPVFIADTSREAIEIAIEVVRRTIASNLRSER